MSAKACAGDTDCRAAGTPGTHRGGGGDLLGHNLQGVDHRDVAQPLRNGQGGVTILERGNGRKRVRKEREDCDGSQ